MRKTQPKAITWETAATDMEKRRTRTDEIEKIMAIYAKGMSPRDIKDILQEIYGSEISQATISRITNRILPKVNKWQNRTLDSIYAIIFFDGIAFNIKGDFPTNDSICKVIYMSVTKISKKWKMPVRDYGLAYAQFSV